MIFLSMLLSMNNPGLTMNREQEAPRLPFTNLADLCLLPECRMVRSRTDYWFRSFQRILEEAEYNDKIRLDIGTLYTFLVEKINQVPSPGVYLYGVLYLGPVQGWAEVSMVLPIQQPVNIPFVAGRILHTNPDQSDELREVYVTDILDISGATRETQFDAPHRAKPLFFVVTDDCKIQTDRRGH